MMLETKNKDILFYLSLSYLFSVLMRYVLVYRMGFDSSIMWNKEYMILSPDGYYYAIMAKDEFFNINGLFPLLTALLVKLLPFSFETIIFYMSTYLSSLIVIPVFFITKKFANNPVAFASAILSSISIAYYERTLSGYYDTDMLIIVLPMFIYWFLIESTLNKDRLFTALTIFTVLISSWWLSSNIALNLSIAIMLLIYTLLFERKSIFNYFIFILFVIAAIPIGFFIKLPIIFLLYLILFFQKYLNKNILIGILLVLLLSFAVGLFIYNNIIFNLIFQKLSFYFEKKSDFDNGLYFADSGSLVREVTSIKFMDFAAKISGSAYSFIFATIGYLLLIKKYRFMILLLPLLGFGAMAYGIPGYLPSAGARFSFYASPVLAISLVYFTMWTSMKTKKYLPKYVKTRYIFFILFIVPNIYAIKHYNPSFFYNKSDIEILNEFKSKISKDDYVISWWDYGYYLNYYAGAKTVCDGGKQLGKITYPASYIFMNQSQQTSAKLSKILTHEVEKKVSHNYVNMMMKSYNYKDSQTFFKDINTIKGKENKFDTYIYIPRQMISNYSVMNQFYSTDLKTGKLLKRAEYFHLTRFPISFKKAKTISLERGLIYHIDKDELYLTKYKISQKVKRIYTRTVEKGKIKISVQNTRYNTGLSVVHLENGRVIVLDDNALKSTIIQLGVFQNYNPELFEAVILSPIASIYRVK